MKYYIVPLTIALCLMVLPAMAVQEPLNADKTLSPYFFVKSDDSSVDRLPLKSTSAEVSIAGVIADVIVTQVYKNEGKHTLEAIYVFPASTKAAVYGMKMTIGERTIIAKIREREKARQEYEKAKQEGKSASLLEQQRPNVFQMSIANILPNDVIKVELKYTELIVPADGVYEFVYPTVVGPRYSDQKEEAAPTSEHWIKNPYLHEGEAPSYLFDIKTKISTGMPVQDISCTSHKVNINFENPLLVQVKLDESEKTGGNRDYILKYRLTGGKIQSGLLLYEGVKENFFLLMVQPPKRITQAQIPSREYIFIVDVSGSMHGFPMDISKNLMKNLIHGLRPSDTFNVLLFAGRSALLSEKSLSATPENINRIISEIERQRGGGGTRLLPAMKRALALPRNEISRSIVIVTDGYVSVEKETFDFIRKNLGDANMFPFGIGSSVNRYLIEGMARVGMGEPFIITKKAEASQKAETFRKYIQSPVLTNIKLNFKDFEAYDVEPPAIPDLMAERPVIAFGKWKNQPDGKIKLSGLSSEQKYTSIIDAGRVKPLEINGALRYLWARHRIALLSDYNKLDPDDDNIKEITRLGLDYNLLTAYTSFVAIDSQIRNQDGKLTTVKQPLPLPQGVSDYAVGSAKKMTLMRSMPFTSAPSAPGLQYKGAGKASPGLNALEEVKQRREITEKESIKRKDKDEAHRIELKGKVNFLSDETAVSGMLSKELFNGIIQKHLKEIKNCYQKVLKNEPSIKGKATLRIVIDAQGMAKQIRFISKELSSKELKECIITLVKQWHFPASKDGRAVNVVDYILVFRDEK
ncbi:Trypsin [Candidatus Magnetomoraceae bacterium gMMP-15]